MIRVFGKPGCEMCDKAKDKLQRLGLSFSFVDVSTADDWRLLGMIDFMAEKSFRQGDGAPELPLICFDGQWCNYPEAMAYAKKLLEREGEK